jgi:hypothetical protein
MLISSNEAERWDWTAAAQYAGTRNVHLRIWCVHITYYTCWWWWWWRCILLVTLVPCARRLEGRRHARSFVTCQLSHVRAALWGSTDKKNRKSILLFFLFTSSIAKSPPHHIRVKSEKPKRTRASQFDRGERMRDDEIISKHFGRLKQFCFFNWKNEAEIFIYKCVSH